MDSDLISVRNTRLRRLLRSDLTELESAREQGLHKASVILAGGVIEAVLIDYLDGIGFEGLPKGTEPAKMTLGNLIIACGSEGALSAQTVSMCHVVKEYRNLVHPGRTARYGDSANEDEASLALTLVEHVFANVEARALKRPEWAAEALYDLAVTKESLEWQAHNVPRKVRALATTEAQRLLPEVIPDRLSEPVRPKHCETLEVRVAMVSSLVDHLLPKVSTAAKAELARRLLDKIGELEDQGRNPDLGEFNLWITAIFRPSLLEAMDQSERDELLAYIFEEVEMTRQVQWGVPNLVGIGAYLSPSSAPGLVAALTDRIGVDDSSPSLERTLADEMLLLPGDSVEAAREALDAAVDRNTEWPQVAARLGDLRYEIWPLQDEEIPR